jgi:hypothetical protein
LALFNSAAFACFSAPVTDRGIVKSTFRCALGS